MAVSHDKGLSAEAADHTDTRALVRRLLRERLRRYTGRIVASLFCMVVVAAATAGNAWLMQYFWR